MKTLTPKETKAVLDKLLQRWHNTDLNGPGGRWIKDTYTGYQEYQIYELIRLGFTLVQGPRPNEKTMRALKPKKNLASSLKDSPKKVIEESVKFLGGR